MDNDYAVVLTKLVGKMKLENCTPNISTDHIYIRKPDINRPALQLAGFMEDFDHDRIQIIGNVEHSYLMRQDNRAEIMDKFLSLEIPCVVFCNGFALEQSTIDAAEKYGVPLLRTNKTTSSFMAEVIRWLNVELAPTMTIHGVLVDVYGEGVLITGESGIGKSEAALELIKRGHRLISDDVVEIRKVSDDTLVGTSPEMTRHFIELRGIGIIDVKTLFGVESVKNTGNIDLVINLEDWDREKEYDRMGLEEHYVNYLGNNVVCHNIPIRPGRNLAVICESAAVNFRQKKMGYNAAQTLYDRAMANIAGVAFKSDN
ncbi:MAG: HPr(Ser) kinase/phosphatase [Lachnospiraceae bacterium]|nr:HPr(Ser) kinase/phosphatase [Lachnospiraceae bacterium]